MSRLRTVVAVGERSGRMWTMLLWSLVLAVPTVAQDDRFLAVPAAGNIDLAEGTIECWIKFRFDPGAVHDGWRGRGELFWLDYGDPVFRGDGWRCSIGTKAAALGPGSGRAMDTIGRFAIVAEGREVHHPVFPLFGRNAMGDVWRHFAITWSGRTVRFHIDGRPVQFEGATELVYRDAFARPLSSKAMFGIGVDPRLKWALPDNAIAMDDLRISAVARSPDQLGHRGAVTRDAYTLLLIDCDIPGSGDERSITIIAANAPSLAIERPADWRFVEGRFGQALAFGVTDDASR